MASNGLNIDDLQITITANVEDATSALKELTKAALSSNDGVTGAFSNIMKTVEKTIGSLTSKVSQATQSFEKFDSTLKDTADSAEETGAAFEKAASGGLSKFFSTVKRIATYRLIRSALKMIIQGFKEGIENLVAWDAAFGNNSSGAVATMTQIKSLALQIKNTLGAMAMPIIQGLLPVLQIVARVLLGIWNIVNALARLLGGHSTFIKATYNEVSAVTDETKKAAGAAKELQRVLFGFDELNVLPSKSSGGAGAGISGASVEDMFKEVSIKEFFSNIWEQIKHAWDDLGKFFSEFWKIIKENAIETWENVKKAFVNAGTWFYEKVIVPIGDFFVNLWDKITTGAKKAWDGVTGWFANLGEWFRTKIITPIATFFTNLWDGIKNGATRAWTWVTSKATEAWNGVKDVWNGLKAWVNDKIVTPVKNAWNAVKEAVFTPIAQKWEEVKRGAADAWEGIKKPFLKAKDWFSDVFGEAWRKVAGIFSGDSDVIREIRDGLSDAFKRIVNRLISGVNSVISRPFNALNNILRKIRDVTIFGWTPFSEIIGTISAPQIPLLAQGGVVPNTGSLFYAGEAGAEVVANMGHSTGVMNISQMQEAVASGNIEVVNAVYAMANAVVNAVNGKNFDVYMDSQKVGHSVTQYQIAQSRRLGTNVI